MFIKCMKDNRKSSHYQRYFVLYLQYRGYSKLSWILDLYDLKNQPIPITISWSTLKVGRRLYGIVASQRTICGISTVSGVLQTILELIPRCPGGSTDTHFDIWVNSNGRQRVVWHYCVTQDDLQYFYNILGTLNYPGVDISMIWRINRYQLQYPESR